MRYPLRISLIFVLFCLFLAACGGATSSGTGSATTPSASTPAGTVTLNVFAAASLTESFGEIAQQYKTAHPNVEIKYNFNGSQILEQQIANGANADVFASADTTNMQKASTAGVVDTPQVFVRNKLVVIVPANNPGNITGLKDLAHKGLKIDMEAPAVPAGKYSLQVLDKLGKSADYGPDYEKAVKGNFVSQEENVKAVVQKVQLGEADAGFVYRTDVTSAVANKVKIIDIPDTFNVIAEYPLAVTKHTQHAEAAQAFVQYLLSPQGQTILTKYGFIAPKGASS
ncbi:molybdate ABC transporter substrate-binding protein [Ktedonosporobacter rubrisoli]|uniref:Molybdate ABC transporter substrate-binding protein n=1 Tax=Ktedonosporobacter rubrisoli TaxID=2509675 RepID=A0A4P6JYH8_KTERU|nr:molybdate ABC transporter substrate-binding protein [Ktedonosporobacter rubrisoli]QBD80500.1 molybdate ABC transporter substrate-binding protein [Ktedonosporobacter rubrisoli]